ncbi:methyltransferase [Agaribacter flavus]|uniref:Ribosomal RNA large subunit methyltransferase G n=1 Tax=Agaribacter flavus TaxID=1902781 RepID=A0ABV7FM48_9ALTE
MSNTDFHVNDTVLSLHRYPPSRDKSLQAWDSADEYIIRYIETEDLYSKLGNMLIVNDEFGALCCNFHEYSPTLVSDSFLSHRAIEKNFLKNLSDKDAVPQINYSDALSMTSLNTAFDSVLIKIPRTLALLEHQLIALQQLVHRDTLFIAAGKVKAITNSVLSLIDKHLGKASTSLAQKKARLVFCAIDDSKQSVSPYPTRINDPSINFELINHANVFCREHLDIGARMLLKHLPKSVVNSNSQQENSRSKRVIDLGCGNGVIGIQYLLNHPNHHVMFVDESYMAVASAKAGAEKAGVFDRASFLVSDCLSELQQSQEAAFDLVLCNPPFHQQNTITDDIAWRMFSHAHQYLKVNGELRVVANRHLDYANKLKRLFGGTKIIGSNKKFVVFSAIKN